MRSLILTLALASCATPGFAGGLDNPWARPPVAPPDRPAPVYECWLIPGLLPCNEGVYTPSPADPDRPQQSTPSEPRSEPEPRDEPASEPDREEECRW